MADENKVEFVTVKAAKEDSKVALFEQNSDHITEENKTGEVFISGDGKAHTVARTPAVEQKLRDGVLVEVSKAEASKAVAMPPPPPLLPPVPGSGMPPVAPPVAPLSGEPRSPSRTRPSN